MKRMGITAVYRNRVSARSTRDTGSIRTCFGAAAELIPQVARSSRTMPTQLGVKVSIYPGGLVATRRGQTNCMATSCDSVPYAAKYLLRRTKKGLCPLKGLAVKRLGSGLRLLRSVFAAPIRTLVTTNPLQRACNASHRHAISPPLHGDHNACQVESCSLIRCRQPSQKFLVCWRLGPAMEGRLITCTSMLSYRSARLQTCPTACLDWSRPSFR